MLLLLGIPLTCAAQFKCVHADGKVSFQQMPCAEGSKSNNLDIRPGSGSITGTTEAQKRNWAAIARGMPEVGMTLKDLEAAMGQPSKANLAQYGPNTHDQLIYYRSSRTIYVYLRNGVVTSVQNQAGGEIKVGEPYREPCPTPVQIKELEFEASRIANRDNQEMHTALAKARVCR